MGRLRRDGQCCGREVQCGRRTKRNWTKTAHNNHGFIINKNNMLVCWRYLHVTSPVIEKAGYSGNTKILILPSRRGQKAESTVCHTLTTSGSISPLQLSKYFFKSWSEYSNTSVSFFSLWTTSQSLRNT